MWVKCAFLQVCILLLQPPLQCTLTPLLACCVQVDRGRGWLRNECWCKGMAALKGTCVLLQPAWLLGMWWCACGCDVYRCMSYRALRRCRALRLWCRDSMCCISTHCCCCFFVVVDVWGVYLACSAACMGGGHVCELWVCIWGVMGVYNSACGSITRRAQRRGGSRYKRTRTTMSHTTQANTQRINNNHNTNQHPQPNPQHTLFAAICCTTCVLCLCANASGVMCPLGPTRRADPSHTCGVKVH